jgi:hypothetical protein
VFFVEGLGGQPETRLASVITLTGIPQVGDPHPGDDSLPVASVSVVPAEGSPGQAYVTVEYGHPLGGGGVIPEPGEPPVMEVVGSVQTTTTNKDLNDNAIIVNSVRYEDNEPIYTPQGGEVQYQQPMFALVFRRKETSSPGIRVTNGRKGAKDYIGHVNANNMMLDGSGVWLCTRMEGPSRDGGRTYEITYEFQRRLPDWRAFVVAVDPTTGQKVPINTTEYGITHRHVDLYPSADFDELGLWPR